MHDEYYGLCGRPFQLAPDPRFWFDTATHAKALACLRDVLRQGDGAAVLTGDPGAGKTILMSRLAREIDADQHRVIQIASTQLRGDDLMRLVAQAVGAEWRGLSRATLFSAIEHCLRQSVQDGRRVLLLVDDAHALLPDSLDTLRQLAFGSAPIQILLFAEPKLRLLLQQPEWAPLAHRVIATAHLTPMEVEDVDPYLRHRLCCVGWHGRPQWTGEARVAMHRWSGGIPRRLNLVADRLLLQGAVQKADILGAPDVAAAIEDIARQDADRVQRNGGAAGMEAGALEQRVSELEAQLQSQRAAMRQVLQFLTDWLGQDERRRDIDLQALRTMLG